MARRRCDSYDVFLLNLDRAQGFLRIFDRVPRAPGPPARARSRGQPSNDEKELLRGAVVFAIAALDAFLHDLVLEIVPQFGGSSSGLADALKAIAKEDPGLSLRVALAPDAQTKTTEFRAALDSWLSSKSFQGPQAVVAATTYVGVNLSWQDLEASAGADCAARLKTYTDMRHDIVHRGRRPQITRAKAQTCLDLVASLARPINDSAVKFYL